MELKKPTICVECKHYIHEQLGTKAIWYDQVCRASENEKVPDFVNGGEQ